MDSTTNDKKLFYLIDKEQVNRFPHISTIHALSGEHIIQFNKVIKNFQKETIPYITHYFDIIKERSILQNSSYCMALIGHYGYADPQFSEESNTKTAIFNTQNYASLHTAYKDMRVEIRRLLKNDKLLSSNYLQLQTLKKELKELMNSNQWNRKYTTINSIEKELKKLEGKLNDNPLHEILYIKDYVYEHIKINHINICNISIKSFNNNEDLYNKTCFALMGKSNSMDKSKFGTMYHDGRNFSTDLSRAKLFTSEKDAIEFIGSKNETYDLVEVVIKANKMIKNNNLDENTYQLDSAITKEKIIGGINESQSVAKIQKLEHIIKENGLSHLLDESTKIERKFKL